MSAKEKKIKKNTPEESISLEDSVEKLEIEEILERGHYFDSDDIDFEEKELPAFNIKKELDDEVVDLADTAISSSASEDDSDNSEEILGAKPLQSKKVKKKNFRFVATVVLTALITAAVVMGGVYFFEQRNEKEDSQPLVTEEEVTPEVTEDVFLYINSISGLNMRERPELGSSSLAVIPYGTRVPVLEEVEGWARTGFEDKNGWISTQFTVTESPLVYESQKYSFRITFNSRWAGYRLIETKGPETSSRGYYVTLPTTQRDWRSVGVGIPANHALLFTINVFERADWDGLSESNKPKPTKIEESDQYVFAYTLERQFPTDLRVQSGQIDEIIKTFEVIKR